MAETAPQRRAGFGKDRRIRQSADFVDLLKSGRKRAQGGFTFYVRHRDTGGPRLGLLVTRKHSRLSVERNRLKRYVREAFRLEQAALGPIDVLVRPPYRIKLQAALVTRVRRCLRSLNPSTLS